MKKDKYIKRLAEQHFFLGKTLNLEEYKTLKNSKYSKLVKENVKSVDSIIEKVSDGKEYKTEEPKFKKRSNVRNIHVGFDRQDLLDLIDDVELEFNLDLSNSSPFKFGKVDAQKLKDFIRKYSNIHIKDMDTLDHINKIVNNPELKSSDVLYRLYSAAGV